MVDQHPAEESPEALIPQFKLEKLLNQGKSQSALEQCRDPESKESRLANIAQTKLAAEQVSLAPLSRNLPF
jgi:hypothetical protein